MRCFLLATLLVAACADLGGGTANCRPMRVERNDSQHTQLVCGSGAVVEAARTGVTG